MDRREFLKIASATAALSATGPVVLRSLATAATSAPDVMVAKNASPAELVRAVVDGLGGMSKFVSKGDVVVVKPNMGWDRRPEQAANTNPEVVAEVVRLCYEVGAKEVRVFDRTCNRARRCYLRSGIQKAAKAAGAKVSYCHENKFKDVAIPGGEMLKSWPFYKDALEADVFINVPIAKHHAMAGLTIGLKNIMGVIGGDRGKIHNHFPVKLADLNLVLKPQLTIVDAYRILVANGPQGGNLRDVRMPKVVLASVDRVAADAYAATLFGKKGTDLPYLVEAHKRGFGEIDLAKVAVKEVDLSSA